jgi:penicillin G amidase
MNKEIGHFNGKVLALHTLIIWFACTISVYSIGKANQLKKDKDSTRLQISGLQLPTTVRRDYRGIPYIEASNEYDLYFTQGYVTAVDRLWQMDLLRRTVRGTLSEVFGESTVEEDKKYRKFGFASLANSMFERSSPPVRSALTAYTNGVNAYIATLGESSLPIEFRILQYRPQSWSPTDSLLIGKILAEALSISWHLDLIRASLVDLPPDKRNQLLMTKSDLDLLLVGRDYKVAGILKENFHSKQSLISHTSLSVLEKASALMRNTQLSLSRLGLDSEHQAVSNSWVVSGKHTISGKPLLANDPHLSPSVPSIWYMTNLREMKKHGLHAAGVTIPGVPGIVIGHNEEIAWGITNLNADVQDLYAQKIDEQKKRYLTSSGWQYTSHRREVIKVRKSSIETATNEIAIDVMETKDGPIFFEDRASSTSYALKWTALDPQVIELEAFYFLNRARNWKEFRGALSRYSGTPQNFVYADRHNHIGYSAAGRVPIRESGNGSLPYDGSKDEGKWIGYVPFKELPQLYNPPSGIIVTANNRIVGDSYPHFLTNAWSSPYRARRIYDLLTSKKQQLSISDFRSILADKYSFTDAIFAREIVKIARPLANNSSEWKRILNTFEGWDGGGYIDSKIMPLSYTMYEIFQKRILVGTLGAEKAARFTWPNRNSFIDWIITTRPHNWLPSEFNSYEDLILDSYKEAYAEVTKRLGADESKWRWGDMGQSEFKHPLSDVPTYGQSFQIAPLPQQKGGSGPTVNLGLYVSMRFIADLSNLDLTEQGITLGQSGDPNSPQWKDQLNDWIMVTPQRFPFTPVAILSANKETKRFIPNR